MYTPTAAKRAPGVQACRPRARVGLRGLLSPLGMAEPTAQRFAHPHHMHIRRRATIRATPGRLARERGGAHLGCVPLRLPPQPEDPPYGHR